MSISYPDNLVANSSTFYLVDESEIRGTARPISTFNNTQLATLNPVRIKVGSQIIATDTNTVYACINASLYNNTTGWTTIAGTTYTAGNLMSLAGGAVAFVGGNNGQNITVDVSNGGKWTFRSSGTTAETLILKGQSSGGWAKLTFDPSSSSGSSYIDTLRDGMYFQANGVTQLFYDAAGVKIGSLISGLAGFANTGYVGAVSVSNGITYSDTGLTVKLGGQLDSATTINMNGNAFTFQGNGSGLFTLQNTTANGSIGQTFTGGASPVSNVAFVNATSVTGFQFQFSGTSVGSYNATSWTFAQRATFSNGFNVANAINNGIGTASSDSRLMILGNTAGVGSSEKILRLANSTGDLMLISGNGTVTSTQYTNFANASSADTQTGYSISTNIALGASASAKTYTGFDSRVTISGGVTGQALVSNFFTGGVTGAASPNFAAYSTYFGTTGLSDGQMFISNSAGTKRLLFSQRTDLSEAYISHLGMSNLVISVPSVFLSSNGINLITQATTSSQNINGFAILQNGPYASSTATQVGSYSMVWKGSSWNGSTFIPSWFNARLIADTTVNQGRWLRMFGGVGNSLVETGTSAFSIYYGGAGGERFFGILKDSPAATLHIGASATNVPQIILDTTSVTGTPTNGSIWFDGTNFRGVTGGTVKTFTLV